MTPITLSLSDRTELAFAEVPPTAGLHLRGGPGAGHVDQLTAALTERCSPSPSELENAS